MRLRRSHHRKINSLPHVEFAELRLLSPLSLTLLVLLHRTDKGQIVGIFLLCTSSLVSMPKITRLREICRHVLHAAEAVMMCLSSSLTKQITTFSCVLAVLLDTGKSCKMCTSKTANQSHHCHTCSQEFQAPVWLWAAGRSLPNSQTEETSGNLSETACGEARERVRLHALQNF